MPCIAAGRLPRTIIDSWLALPSRLSDGALDLLVVLELQLEQPDHLHRRAGRAGDRDAAVAVGLHDLLHRAVARSGCRRWPAGRRPSPRRRRSAARRTWWRAGRRARQVAACRSRDGADGSRARRGAAGPESSIRGRRPDEDRHRHGLLPALLHVGLDEVLGVGLEHAVDLVEQVVELGLQLLARLRSPRVRRPRRPRLGAVRCRLVLLGPFSHGARRSPSVDASGAESFEQLGRGVARRRSTYPRVRPCRAMVPSSAPAAADRGRRRRPASPSWRRRCRRPTSARQRPRK